MLVTGYLPAYNAILCNCLYSSTLGLTMEDGAAVSENKRPKITDEYPPFALSDISDEATNCRNKRSLGQGTFQEKSYQVNGTRVNGAHIQLPEGLYCQ